MENATLRPYADYKPSGIEWLGDVPAHWEMTRGKRLFSKMERSVREYDDVVTCFRDGIVTLRKNRRELGFTESLKEIGYQGIRDGDLVIHSMDAFAGAVGVADSDGKGTPVYSVCKPGPEADSYFYAYLLREMARNKWIQALSKGIRQRSSDFRYSDFGSQFLPLPPLEEQTAIVHYLDHAADRIRRAISAKERLIELLTEQRQAVIHRAVTRGLDPNVRLKDSGVEWLGDVPAHWKVAQLGRIGKFMKCSGGTKADEEQEGIPCVRYGDLYTFYGAFIERSRSFIAVERAVGYTQIKYGDILFAGSGETIDDIGKSAVNLIESEVRCGGDVILFRPKLQVDAKYSGYLLDSSQSREQKSRMGRGFTIMHIYGNDLKYLWLSIPPLREQSTIVRYLDKTTADISTAIDKAQRQIGLLREYRTRLIADVVTGQVDVRGAVRDEVELPVS